MHKDIAQLAIFLKDSEQERMNETIFLQPLLNHSAFKDEHKEQREVRLHFFDQLSFPERVMLKLKKWWFKRLPVLIGHKRVTQEAKFMTAIATLLVQERLQEFFLGSRKKRTAFVQALERGARLCGLSTYKAPHLDEGLSLAEMAEQLTYWPDGKTSLLTDLYEFSLQLLTLKKEDKNAILYPILNRIERPPITSCLEITGDKGTSNIEVTTKYVKSRISDIDLRTGRVFYECLQGHNTSPIRTQSNILANVKGPCNQRVVYDTSDMGNPEWIGAYSGELSCRRNVLEQILFIMHEEDPKEVFLLDHPPLNEKAEEINVLFTSLFSLSEYEKILQQWEAIRELHHKGLRVIHQDGSSRYVHLNLYYHNIPFSVASRFPIATETQARMEEINEESLIELTHLVLHRLHLPCDSLESLLSQLYFCPKEGDLKTAFFQKRKELLKATEAFSRMKQEIVKKLPDDPEEAFLLKALLSKKRPDGKKLSGIDELIYIGRLATLLGLKHTKNCHNALDRSSSAKAADKAQNSFIKIKGKPFLPGKSADEGTKLFKVLYSMYLVWEEPELNATLAMGSLEPRSYRSLFHKNPETTRYLIAGARKNLDLHFGLHERSFL